MEIAKSAKVAKSISLNALLGVLVMMIPLGMIMPISNGGNPFVDHVTTFVVFLMSVFLLILIWINRQLRIPLLDVFILVYVVFWHFRFLTLTLFPSSELVLSRTVLIDHEIFNSYVWIVFASLLATAIGILAAYMLSRIRYGDLIKKETSRIVNLNGIVKTHIHGVFAYCVLSLIYLIYSTQTSAELLPAWLGYMGFFFPFNLIMLLVALVLLNNEVSNKFRLIFLIYMLSYVAFTVVAGSRSILLYFILSGVFLFAVLGRQVRIKLGHFLLLLLIGGVILFSFAYGTYQRHMRSVSGFATNAESTQYILDRMSNLEGWEPLIGMAAARAGSLDFSAEMFSNPEYGEVVSIENELKSTIDNYIPTAVFADSRLIEQRVIDIYNPRAVGYQSDALGAVGETYLLFGYAFPLVIALVAFAFTFLFYAISGSIYGVYFKFSLAVGIMSWWNSFGYDWLLVNSGRQLLCGLFIIAIIFYRRALPGHARVLRLMQK